MRGGHGQRAYRSCDAHDDGHRRLLLPPTSNYTRVCAVLAATSPHHAPAYAPQANPAPHASIHYISSRARGGKRAYAPHPATRLPSLRLLSLRSSGPRSVDLGSEEDYTLASNSGDNEGED
jgi:hypothetical protein